MFTKIPIEIIEIENEGFHLLIEGKINKNKCFLIIDTGASKSVFNRRLSDTGTKENANMHKFDLHTTTLFSDEIPSISGTLKELKIGNLHIKNFEATFIDIDYINKLYQDTVGKKIDGLIGNDLLVRHNAIIDYSGRSLTLSY